MPELEAALRSSKKRKAPGPDGIPYACWTAAGDTGVRTLEGLSLTLTNGAAAHLIHPGDLVTVDVYGGHERSENFTLARREGCHLFP